MPIGSWRHSHDDQYMQRISKPLYLSNTPILGGTARILQYWLQLSQREGQSGHVVVREGSDFIRWSREHHVSVLVDSMPIPNRLRPWESLCHARRVARWSKRQNVDVIHCNEHDIYPFVFVLKRFLKLPTVCHVRYKIERGFAEWAFGGSRGPDALLWTSYQQKADSADAIAGIIPEERQHVVRLGVDLETFGSDIASGRQLRQQWQIADDEIVIGIPSPLRPRKRIEDFVTAFASVAARHAKVVGLIAGGEIEGDEPYRKQIEAQIAQTGLGRRLRWVGFLEPIEPFHHACDISVSTSEYETFGNSVCEAMACGKPVVGYAGGSVAEVIGDTGIVVATGDVDALTNGLFRLVGDANLRLAFGNAARKRVEHEFNPKASLTRVHEIYQSITGL